MKFHLRKASPSPHNAPLSAHDFFAAILPLLIKLFLSFG
jgi:hypothetical protein